VQTHRNALTTSELATDPVSSQMSSLVSSPLIAFTNRSHCSGKSCAMSVSEALTSCTVRMEEQRASQTGRGDARGVGCADGVVCVDTIFHPAGAEELLRRTLQHRGRSSCAIRSPHNNRHPERLFALVYARTLMACTVRDEDEGVGWRAKQEECVLFDV
jgi:hypothetical protein